MQANTKQTEHKRNIFLKKIFGSQNFGDLIFERLTLLFAVFVFLLVILMGYEMYIGSKISIEKFGWSFLTNSVWDPVQEIYGALPIIYGTVVSSFLALILSVPLSIGIAIFLSELSPGWLEKPLSFLVELLAGIPSVVYGLWGIFVLVPWIRNDVEPFLSERLGFLPFFRGAPYGFGMLAAVLILSIMVLPIVASISRDILKSVPQSQREAALALGATRWQSTKIVLKDARSGIFGATMLGLGRAVGETMAVTMVIGNRALISPSLFDPAYTMASVIANEFSEATSDMYLSALIQLALVLFVITIFINAFAKLLVWSMERKLGTR
ncbi:MAG: phosphate ABC transporter permease subunit PstC [Ignavibacteria bacterium CG_4_8_14_3_um_filter_37_9]|nr:phosphate ABC transporter permease subunit PstC [Ignavibacteria bacterium]PIP79531.1 MAG: phosphate ABC transporter permease subunit PstC [Ignavibacteria bacterium CG22_combo_CG10-13_8_21_14_all_37_15]PIS45750.1 MAG: phosphate ABC transporter permease subunit PstC [Ignavibacteria bacterium CG08_land_8_20_14_0_20_37_9]PIW99502.1 MAG: phosphate ABC transporter permease subunit PstC [Ignavibacteria bacterium CG_4_8_14_3_um_filter_37_9]PIX94189.1 MAG: phosphate ABC transporter permease subunit P